MKRKCLYCNEEVGGHLRKRYCNEVCRESYYIKNKKEEHLANREIILKNISNTFKITKPKYPNELVPLYRYLDNSTSRRGMTASMEAVNIRPIVVPYSKNRVDSHRRTYKSNAYKLIDLYNACIAYNEKYKISTYMQTKAVRNKILSFYEKALIDYDKKVN